MKNELDTTGDGDGDDGRRDGVINYTYGEKERLASHRKTLWLRTTQGKVRAFSEYRGF